MDVIAPLSADFHLVIPSLPGYGFSGKPTVAKWSVEHIAAEWDELMRAIGYDRYFAQGGDWGSAVTCAIGVGHGDTCAGISVHTVLRWSPPAQVVAPTHAAKTTFTRIPWSRAQDGGARQH